MKTLITWFLNQVMLQKALQQAGAAQCERTDAGRQAHRNGYKDRSSRPDTGDDPPETASFGSFPLETQVSWTVCPGGEGSGECNRRILPLGTLVEKISDFRCVSTRRVQEIVSHLGIDRFSGLVSRMAKDLDDQVQAFLSCGRSNRLVDLFVDASYYKIRDRPRDVTRDGLVVAGVREDGYREILGARVTDCENEEFWSGLFEDLKERGLAWGSTGHL